LINGLAYFAAAATTKRNKVLQHRLQRRRTFEESPPHLNYIFFKKVKFLGSFFKY